MNYLEVSPGSNADRAQPAPVGALSRALALLVTLAVVAEGPAWAQAAGATEQPVGQTAGGDDALYKMDLESLLSLQVVTSSGGAAEERVLAAANVSVVRREEIVRRGWRSLADVLSNQPGLYVIDDHVLPSVGVRGVTGGLRAGTRVIKVMINGVAVNFRPDLTAFLGPEFIPMGAVERVEIVQGPLSALYGANAFIATVNVITREPVDGAATEFALGANAVEGHLGGSVSMMTVQGDESLGLLFAVSAGWVERSGLRVDHTFAAQDEQLERFNTLLTTESRDDVTAPKSIFLRGHLGVPDGKWGRLTLQGGLQQLDAVPEFQVNSALMGRSRVALDNYWLSARHERRWSDALNTQVDLGFSAGHPGRDSVLFLTDNLNASYAPQFAYKAFNGGVSVTYAPLGERLSVRLSADVELDYEDILFYRQTLRVPSGTRPAGDEVDLITDGTDRTQLMRDLGFGLKLNSRPLPRRLPGLRVTGEVRTDVIHYGPVAFPVQLSGRAGVVYRWSPQLVTKLIGGHAFQTPSAVLMFAQGGFGLSNNVLGNFDVTSVGIASLEPQTVSGVEAITSMELFGLLTIDTGLYFQRVDNRIVFRPLATDFVAENDDEGRSSLGLNVELNARWRRLSGYATFAGQLQVYSDGFSSDPPEQYPSLFGTAGLNVDVPEIHLRGNAHLRWASERGSTQSNTLLNNAEPYTVAGYATLDLTVTTVGWQPLGSETRFSATVRNVGGTRYAEPGFAGFDIPSLGRSFWLQLRQVF